MQTFAVTVIVFMTMLWLWNRDVDKKRCKYCGVYNGHEQHCPYRL